MFVDGCLCVVPACLPFVPFCHRNHHYVSRSFLTVTSPLCAGAPLEPPAPPGPPDPAPGGAADGTPDAPLPRMVDTSPCMNAQGGLFTDVSRGQRPPLGQ